MRLSGPNWFIIALLGIAAMMPFYLSLNGAPIFYVQLGVVILLLPFVRVRIRALSVLDLLIITLLLWNAVSFVINIPGYLVIDSDAALSKQAVSFGTFLLLLSSCLIGRYFITGNSETNLFVSVVSVVFAVMVSYYIYYYSENYTDLYLARQNIEQRLPMMITFIIWGICSLGFWGYQRGKTRIILFACASAIVVLSLTRAAYLQWLASAMAFVLISLMRARRVRLDKVIKGMMVALVIVAVLILSVIIFNVKGALNAEVIVDRIVQLVSPGELVSTDESANVRFEIWHHLLSKIMSSPFRVIFGYGQLGPSYLGDDFVSLYGETIATYSAHSQYLDTFIRSGIIGVFLEVIMMLAVIIIPFTLHNEDGPVRFFQAHSVALIGVLVYGFFHETLRWQMFGFYFWLYVGILSARLYPRHAVLNDPEHKKESAWLAARG